MARIGFAFGVSAQLSVQDVVELAKTAEEKGYESFWITEGSGRDSISQLAVVAANTSDIRLGTGIVNIYSRSPSLMAMTAASMDDISQGRFILGLGAGHKQTIEGNHGVPLLKPATRMRDYISIVKSALKGGQVAYQGGAVSVSAFTLAMKPFRSSLPVYVATLGGPMAEVAGEVADGVVPLLASPEGIQELVSGIKMGAERVGRSPSEVDVACFIIAAASHDASAAEAEARRQIARYARLPFYQKMMRISGFEPEMEVIAKAWVEGNGAEVPGLISDRMLDSLALIGNPEDWTDSVQRFVDAGVTLPIVYAAAVGEDALGSLQDALNPLAPSLSA